MTVQCICYEMQELVERSKLGSNFPAAVLLIWDSHPVRSSTAQPCLEE